jgi:hypothetical protein
MDECKSNVGRKAVWSEKSAGEQIMVKTDQELISEYMNWKMCLLRNRFTRVVDGERLVINFDMNDAELCTHQMIKKNDFDLFMNHVWTTVGLNGINYVRYLFNSKNFFRSMAGWLRLRG